MPMLLFVPQHIHCGFTHARGNRAGPLADALLAVPSGLRYVLDSLAYASEETLDTAGQSLHRFIGFLSICPAA